MIWLVQDDALGEWSSIARLDVKLNGLTFDECLATFSLNLRVVHKDVGLAFYCDESPTLFVVEPLDGSYSHCGPPCFFGSTCDESGGNHNGNLNPTHYLVDRPTPNTFQGRLMRVPTTESSTVQPRATSSSRRRSASAQFWAFRASSR